MRQKLFIFGFAILMAVVLIGLNAASYTQKQTTPDSESAPNRSSFNAGSTGTQAFYSLLVETGRKVTRWQQPPTGLLTAEGDAPAVFVVIGSIRRGFTALETEELLRWVADGGRLVLIDRAPPEDLVTTTANWQIAVEESESELLSSDPIDQQKMIGETPAARAVQPSVFTSSVNAVQPSRFAASIDFTRFFEREQPVSNSTEEEESQPPTYNTIASPSQIAPVVHFAAGTTNLVVEAQFGAGRIIIVSDPYMVSNAGIGLVDNAQMAINLVEAGDGVIAFDEFHHGYGAENNRFLQFFAGTPVVAIFIQAVIIVGLVFFSQSRRFARPVPETEPDRLSKLEYVAAMAELQNRTRAYDLAIENLYNDFRRRLSRHLGVDNFTAKSDEIAALVAERTGMDRTSIGEAFFRCEEIIRGAPTNKREVIYLAGTLRGIEQKLNLTRATRTRI